MIRLAIQKSGRLSESSLSLLKECDILFNNAGSQQLNAVSANFPAEILLLRDDDIPECVADGVADLGIIGQNVFREKEKDILEIRPLGFSKCRLSIAVPKYMEYRSIKDLNGLNIASSYPVILENFLIANQLQARIHEISGSVEIAPNIGLADAICDIVSSGNTLISNGLKEVELVMKSEAILVANKNLSDEKQSILNQLLFRIEAVIKAKNFRYILMNVPNTAIKAIADLLPGMRSPTVLPLLDTNWSSLHTVVKSNEVWPIIEKCKRLGAEGILVAPIEKMLL